MIPLIFLLVVGAAIASGEEVLAPNYCPPRLNLCSCLHGNTYTGNGTQVMCLPFNDTDTLYKEVQHFRGYHVDYFRFISIDLPYLPPGLFNGTSIDRLFIESSKLENLYDVKRPHPSPFSGLEKILKEFYVSYTKNLDKWYWVHLKNMTALRSLGVNGAPLHFVGHVFAEIGGGSLESMSFSFCDVDRIHPQAFPELQNLTGLSFYGNNIPYLVRTMFPNPANKLRVLDFSGNKLFALPPNMFSNMPALEYIGLATNQFVQFHFHDFEPVWIHLKTLYFINNPLECDCSLVPFKQHYDDHTIPPYHDFDYVQCRRVEDGEKIFLKDFDTTHMHCKKRALLQ